MLFLIRQRDNRSGTEGIKSEWNYRKILTGDSELVAAKVCHEVGLDAGEVVIGSDIETLSDDELANLAQRTTLLPA